MVRVLIPSCADIGAVYHIDQHYILYAAVCLPAGFFNGCARTGYDQMVSGIPSRAPYAVHEFNIAYVDAFHVRFAE